MNHPTAPAHDRPLRPHLAPGLSRGVLGLLVLAGCHGPAPAPGARPAGEATSGGATTATTARCPGDMVLVPAGQFIIGTADPRTGFDGMPARPQVVASAYCMDRTEVSVEAYRRCTAAGACAEPVPFHDSHGNGDFLCNWNRPGADRHPANCVTWAKAQAYCAWSGHDGGARRLPTEVEWEFAARGTAARTYAWGNELAGDDRANLCGAECAEYLHTVDFPAITALNGWTDRSPRTSPVDAHPAGASPEGILNLTGNVGEWVAERYDGSTTPYSELRVSEQGGIGVIRGGSMLSSTPRHVHAAARNREIVTSYAATEGIRCVRDPL
ncbi:MAG: SUMF1/EgtB/PvdO family nonheme iron enzyme [Deltaproteobacteria bacterium]|nr:SUMF1/EgtB/PvdO family nonheme iron enzyme [Myxococcales bacterium]MDP3219026.1 SUMF1/EgtB/PvdO family nonheme iron enzyme [Deltaproteobacteria bacterium]